MTKSYYVMYVVCGNDYEAGPYDTAEKAREHRNDIEGFEGVSLVTVVPRADHLPSEGERHSTHSEKIS